MGKCGKDVAQVKRIFMDAIKRRTVVQNRNVKYQNRFSVIVACKWCTPTLKKCVQQRKVNPCV